MSNDDSIQKAKDLDAQMTARFQQLDAQTRESLAQEATVKASYHHSSVQDQKDSQAAIQASAEKERKGLPRLDPLDMIREVHKMREEGFSEEVIRAAFNEVMDQQLGKPRRSMRRVVKSEGMIAMMSPGDELDYYKKRELDMRHNGRFNDEELNAILEAIELSKQASNRIIQYEKPTIKNYIFRGLLKVFGGPLQFAINFLTAYRSAKYQTKNGVYRK